MSLYSRARPSFVGNGFGTRMGLIERLIGPRAVTDMDGQAVYSAHILKDIGFDPSGPQRRTIWNAPNHWTD